jgi:adenine deaminase
MDIISELWYGNVSPFEQCTRGDKRLKELLKLVARNREELDGTLTEKRKEHLEKFENCMNEMHSITERDAFSYRFRLGVQLMVESFLLPLDEEEN